MENPVSGDSRLGMSPCSHLRPNHALEQHRHVTPRNYRISTAAAESCLLQYPKALRNWVAIKTYGNVM